MAPLKKPDNHLSNPVMDTIYGRRSVRKYSTKDVPDDIIHEIIRAGTYAPTAVNKQPWRFVVIKNRKLIDELDEKAKKIFVSIYKDSDIPELAAYAKNLAKPEVRILYNAPVFILVFASPDAFNEHDCALAAENMMLAAHSLGIGSCWIGLAAGLGADEAFLKNMDIPRGHTLVAPLIFGYPGRGALPAPPRNADVILKWIP